MTIDYATARHALPLLAAGQAQKEITHNEALTALDAMLHPEIEADDATAPPPGAQPGQCWIVATSATGAWAGEDGRIAAMTGGGWRFLAPVAGMQAWLAGRRATFDGTHWQTAPGYVAPQGGGVIDVEARNALSTLADALARSGQIVET